MKNIVKYSVFGSVVFTGSVASAWWCSTCNEDHKEGDVCPIGGAKPCGKCYGIHKPGGICMQFDDLSWGDYKIEDIFGKELKPLKPKESFGERWKRGVLARKKDLDEIKGRIKKLKLNVDELNELLFCFRKHAEELGARMIHSNDGKFKFIHKSIGYSGCNHGYVAPQNNNNHGYHGYVPPQNNNDRGYHGYVLPQNNNNHGYHGYVPPQNNNNRGY